MKNIKFGGKRQKDNEWVYGTANIHDTFTTITDSNNEEHMVHHDTLQRWFDKNPELL